MELYRNDDVRTEVARVLFEQLVANRMVIRLLGQDKILDGHEPVGFPCIFFLLTGILLRW